MMFRSHSAALRSIEFEERLRRTQVLAAAGKAGPGRHSEGATAPSHSPDGTVFGPWHLPDSSSVRDRS